MTTVRQALSAAVTFLEQSGIQGARLDTELLLAHTSSLP